MTKTTKILLALAIAGLVSGLAINSGLVDASTAEWLYVCFPMGAILFGLFLLSKILEKETAAYDQEQRAALAAADAVSGSAATGSMTLSAKSANTEPAHCA